MLSYNEGFVDTVCVCACVSLCICLCVCVHVCVPVYMSVRVLLFHIRLYMPYNQWTWLTKQDRPQFGCIINITAHLLVSPLTAGGLV